MGPPQATGIPARLPEDLAEQALAFVQVQISPKSRTGRFAEPGIRQFLDLGSGLPTRENTHQVAQRVAPDARVVYVDNDRCKSGCAHVRWTGKAAG